MKPVISVKDCRVSFGEKEVLKGIDWTVYEGEIATLIGPNGCGKSTLLHAITSAIKSTGTIHIAGKEAKGYSNKELARYMAFLPQVPSIPKDMLVEELVNCGRFPYQSWWKQQGTHDKEVVDAALEATQVSHLRNQLVSSLSGGERQRVWIAMALAQEPQVLILDEPTTYLDINHQLEIMELLQDLNRREGLTVVMVLHELNQAAQYSHRVGVLYQGQILADGSPKDVMTEELLEKVFAVRTDVEVGEFPYIRIQGLL